METLAAEIREEVRTVVREELSRFLMEIKPYVTDTEQKNIESKIGSPNDYDNDFVEVDL